MIRSVLRTTARKKLGETTAVFWEDSLLNQWAEDAQLDLVWKTKCNRTRSKFTTTALTETTAATMDIVRYTLTTILSGCLKILESGVRIYNSTSNQWRKLSYVTKDELDMMYPNWEKQPAGTPEHYWYSRELNELILFPSAGSYHVGTDYAEANYLQTPTAMALDTASPDIPATMHPAVIDYIVATALESRGYQDIANVQWNQYYTKIKSYMIERDIQEDEEIIMRPGR